MIAIALVSTVIGLAVALTILVVSDIYTLRRNARFRLIPGAGGGGQQLGGAGLRSGHRQRNFAAFSSVPGGSGSPRRSSTVASSRVIRAKICTMPGLLEQMFESEQKSRASGGSNAGQKPPSFSFQDGYLGISQQIVVNGKLSGFMDLALDLSSLDQLI
ncbi:MAG: hypothetical protein IPI57_07300 [Candidatus Competibacteraceae bacterium]|nr:hypothetical protein [Candidatus Competibacteraceae bacterium]